MNERVRISIPTKLVPLFTGPAMYRVAHGGRGSGKTMTFAKMTAIWGMRFGKRGIRGIIACGREFQNSISESSFAEVKAAILSEPFLNDYYECGENYIKSKDGLIEYAFIGLRKQLGSLKSKARILLLWVDEAETVTEEGWVIIDPTIRAPESEIWITYNPARLKSPTNQRFRINPPPQCKIVEMNWRDNPWFPHELEIKRATDQMRRPEMYGHIWEGEYVTVMAGSYFGQGLALAKREGRIGFVAPDPHLPIRAYSDLGGTGIKADAFVLVFVQFVGSEIRVLNYYEAIGQEAKDHFHWLRSNGYEHAQIILPHDGVNHEKTVRNTWESSFKNAGWASTKSIPNPGVGAKSIRIKAVQDLLPSMRFNEVTTQGLRGAMGWYHEQVDAKREIGLGPLHDWSSHACDAIGLMACDYTPPRVGLDARVNKAREAYDEMMARVSI